MASLLDGLLGMYPEFEHYPSPFEVDDIIDGMWSEAEGTPVTAELTDTNGFSHSLALPQMRDATYVRFAPQGRAPFYAYWQPAPSQPAPLLVHTPGYGARMSVHPELVARGYNVLHVNPLGYATPDGADEGKKRGGDDWPVFGDSMAAGFEAGYRPWLLDAMQAVTWAVSQPAALRDRISFFGTSQGGGATLLLGSIFQGHGVRCLAADEPWLVNFPAYRQLLPDWAQASVVEGEASLFDRPAAGDPAVLWRRLALIDAMAHVHRLDLPVLLTAGADDNTCPAASIRSLYDVLPGTKSLTLLKGEGHGYTQQFPFLSAAWFRLYA